MVGLEDFFNQEVTISLVDFYIIGGVSSVIILIYTLAKCLMAIREYNTHLKDRIEFNDIRLDALQKEFKMNCMTISKRMDDLHKRFISMETAITRLKSKIDKIEKSKE